MKITFSDIKGDWRGALCLVVWQGEGLGATGRRLDALGDGQISRAIEASEFAAKKDATIEILAPRGLNADRLILAGGGKKDDLAIHDFETLGGAILGKLLTGREKSAVVVIEDLPGNGLDPAAAVAHLAAGAKLRHYRFRKYLTGDKGKPANLKTLSVQSPSTAAARAFRPLDKVVDGVNLARDLINEPANVLSPAEFAKRVRSLTKHGLSVQVLTEQQMEKLGMRALLAVGLGSANASRLVVMQWRGGRKGARPLAFVGKGVTFDTGGISLKKAPNMDHMKADMGGAACVAGLMSALAARKAKVNAVGVVGLVENMPDAAAQRPGDIVVSMSKQTVEVLNTDAEGRLVLADALWYTNDRFKPRLMIDLATLTGAIITALGHHHAGLFSNDDDLAAQLASAGLETGEKVWRLPLAREYDKLIDSKNADMKNIGGAAAGSITAAQFLQRFVGKTPWAHIDIAGTGFNSPQTAINRSWASGFGVRLLNALIARDYEG